MLGLMQFVQSASPFIHPQHSIAPTVLTTFSHLVTGRPPKLQNELARSEYLPNRVHTDTALQVRCLILREMKAIYLCDMTYTHPAGDARLTQPGGDDSRQRGSTRVVANKSLNSSLLRSTSRPIAAIP
jgi:hypothetical protein